MEINPTLLTTNRGFIMDQFQTLSYLQMALNTNAIFTVATFFILWVAFRFAGKLREGESTMLGRVLARVQK
jgi:hypothetical protein